MQAVKEENCSSFHGIVMETENDYNSINKLNDDCLQEIFQYLSPMQRVRMERVSHTWQVISKSSWNKFTKFDNQFLENEILTKFDAKYSEIIVSSLLSRCGCFLRKVDLILSFKKLQETFFLFILSLVNEFCENIEYLSLKIEIVFDSENIDDILKSVFLKNKNLKCVLLPKVIITGECLLFLPFETVEKIEIRGLQGFINPVHFKVAFSKLKNLKSCGITINNYQSIEAILKEIANNNKNNLVHLKVRHESKAYFTKPEFSNYFSSMKNLKEIELSNVHLSKKDLVSLPMNQMQKLILDNCKFIEHEDLDDTISYFYNLEIIEINRVDFTDKFFSAMAVNCNKLKNIKLTFCKNLTNQGVIEISKLPHLESLTMFFCENVTNLILTKLSHLKNFKFCNNNEITVDDLRDFFEKAVNLESIFLDSPGTKINEKCFDDAFLISLKRNKNIVRNGGAKSCIDWKFVKINEL